jgi:hypothetical protein
VAVTDEHWVKYVIPSIIALFLFTITGIIFVLAGMTAHHYVWLSHAAYMAALLLFLLTLLYY